MLLWIHILIDMYGTKYRDAYDWLNWKLLTPWCPWIFPQIKIKLMSMDWRFCISSGVMIMGALGLGLPNWSWGEQFWFLSADSVLWIVLMTSSELWSAIASREYLLILVVYTMFQVSALGVQVFAVSRMWSWFLSKCCIPCTAICYLGANRSSSTPTFMLGPDANLMSLLSGTATSTMNTLHTGRWSENFDSPRM